MRRRLLALALSGVALSGTALAGCGGSASAVETVRGSAARTVAASTARMAMSLSSSGTRSAFAQGAFAGDGVVDLRHNRGRLTLKLSSLGNVTAEAVYEGAVVYVHQPQLAALAAGKQWLKLDVAQLVKQSGVDLGGLNQLSQTDPTQTLQFLRGVSSNVVKVGTETLRGAKTTHYKVVVDLALAARKAPAALRSAITGIMQRTGVKDQPADVWLDGQGRLRKLAYSQDLAKFSKAQTGTVSITMELYDFGARVHVAVPPASQVTDFLQFLQSARSR
jgi:hypothetical protein